MIAETKFDTSIARRYDATRPMDPAACQAGFEELLSSAGANRSLRVLDVGCGTGRILQHLTPKYLRADQVVGIDISKAMLAVARNKPELKEVHRAGNLRHSSIIDFEQEVRDKEQFDIVICHWFFHCIHSWQASLLACLRLVKKGGVLAWLDEDGDLYEALDNHAPETAAPEVRPLFQLFAEYHRIVRNQLAKTPENLIDPVQRAGTTFRNREVLKDFLSDCGWLIQKSTVSERRWEKTVTAHWLIEQVLKPRIFTNLQAIPQRVNKAAVRELSKKLGRRRLPSLEAPVQIQFRCQGSYAKHNDVLPSQVINAGHILSIAQQIQPYELALLDENDERPRVSENSISLLRQFFISLFERPPSERWRRFWQSQSGNSKGTVAFPEWAWVRLSTVARESFDDYTRKSIYSYSRKPEFLDKQILRLYFATKNTFLSLVRQGPVKLEPVVLQLVKDENDWSVRPDRLESVAQNTLLIHVPISFVKTYCPSPAAISPFSAQDWKYQATVHRKDLLRSPSKADIVRQNLRNALLAFGAKLDRYTNQNRFRGESGLESVVELLQALGLFPGEAFYIFAVPETGGRIGGSITVACAQPLSEIQISNLQEVTELLLQPPAIFASACRRIIQR